MRWAEWIVGLAALVLAAVLLVVPGAPAQAGVTSYVPLSIALVGSNTAAIASEVVAPAQQTDVMTKINIDWTSDASGDYSCLISGPVSGELWSVFAFPDPNDPPSDNYDVVLYNVTNAEYGEVAVADDITSAALANQDVDGDVDVTAFYPTTHVEIPDRLQVVISNAGDTKVGRLVLYVIRRP